MSFLVERWYRNVVTKYIIEASNIGIRTCVLLILLLNAN